MNDDGGPGERAADRAYHLIRDDIISGELVGGRRLGEMVLAEEYGFSRTPIRESLRRLQSEGLIEVLPHKGARVVDWRSLDVEAIYDLRALLEGFVARRAATRITVDEIDRLSDLCNQMDEIVSDDSLTDPLLVDRLADLNRDFHGSVATAAGGYQVAAIRNIVVVLPLVLRMIRLYAVENHRRSNRHHRELLDALRARDGEWAASVMQSHVFAAKKVLLENWDEHEE